MKYLINALLFLTLGASLTAADVSAITRQYWAIMVCVVGIGLNALFW